MKFMAITVSMALLAGAAFAGEGERQKDFRHTLNIGVALTDGNSETTQVNAALISEGEREGLGSIRAGAEVNYAESRTDDGRETTVENARAFTQARKTLSPRTFVSLDLSALRDEIAEIDYRAIVAPGLGSYLIKTPRVTLSIDVGPAYLWEKVAGETDDYAAVRFGERLTFAISETARLWQSAEYIPKADDWSDSILNAELGVEAALTSRMNLRVVLQNRYDNSPAEGLEKNDTSLIAGLGLTF